MFLSTCIQGTYSDQQGTLGRSLCQGRAVWKQNNNKNDNDVDGHVGNDYDYYDYDDYNEYYNGDNDEDNDDDDEDDEDTPVKRGGC